MPALLFEANEMFKFYSANLSDNTVQIIVNNTETDATAIHCEINLSLDELRVLEDWIATQRRLLEANIKKQNG